MTEPPPPLCAWLRGRLDLLAEAVDLRRQQRAELLGDGCQEGLDVYDSLRDDAGLGSVQVLLIDEDTAEGRVLSGPLPMGLNRTPQAVPGLLLVGDAVGAVNPFNGEGIAYAIETGEIAAELVARGAREATVRRSRCNTGQVLRDTYGGYFAIGRQFAKVIGKPAIMGRATTHLLPRRAIMAFALRAMANLSDGRDGDLQDRMLDLAIRVARAA